MAAHLEAHAGGARGGEFRARCCSNRSRTTPAQVEAYLRGGTPIRDPLLAALAEPPLPADARGAPAS